MRDLIEVIDQIIEAAPKEKNFISELKDIKTSVAYAAPEMIPVWWQEVADILPRFFQEPTEEWHYKVIAIFGDKTIEEIKLIFSEQ